MARATLPKQANNRKSEGKIGEANSRMRPATQLNVGHYH